MTPDAAVTFALSAGKAALPAGYTVRRLTPDDTLPLRALRREVLATLSDPDYYRLDGEAQSGDFVADHLGDKGLVLGVFQGGSLAAYGALTLPGPGDCNRGHDLPLPDAALEAVAHVASAMVSPSHRGHGLHHRLVVWRKAIAEALGRTFLFTTVSTRNHLSWGHLIEHGFRIRRILTLGPGLRRYLLHCDLRDPLHYHPGPFRADAACDSLKDCALVDLDRAEGYLAAGLWGIGRRNGPEGWRVVFAAPDAISRIREPAP